MLLLKFLSSLVKELPSCAVRQVVLKMAAMRSVVVVIIIAIVVVIIIICNLERAFLEFKFPWSISKFSCAYDLFHNRTTRRCFDEFYVFNSNIIYVSLFRCNSIIAVWVIQTQRILMGKLSLSNYFWCLFISLNHLTILFVSLCLFEVLLLNLLNQRMLFPLCG